MKGNKGITLIALVITIIVLLILAGVSIAMLTGENSILGRGSQASAENELGAANDAVSLYVADRVAQFYEEGYVKGDKATLRAGLNSYLSTTADNPYGIEETVAGTSNKTSKIGITPLVLEKVIANSKITVDTANGSTILVNWPNSFSDTGDKVICIRLNDNQKTYTSVGTYLNGKMTWKITSAAKTASTLTDTTWQSQN